MVSVLQKRANVGAFQTTAMNALPKFTMQTDGFHKDRKQKIGASVAENQKFNKISSKNEGEW